MLHCAGPFVHTAAPMVRACLAAGVHYLDITGEIDVFEAIMALDVEAKRAGVTLLPGAGFDVVPTDCLAAMLHAALPDAAELRLAFDSGRSGISPGTMKTVLEGAGRGGAIRKGGRIVNVPTLFEVREIPFAGGARLAMAIPWGDVSTAFHTTGIPDIRVYSARSANAIKKLRRSLIFMPLLRIPPVRRFAQRLAAKRPGPSADVRAKSRVRLWGSVRNARGEERSMTMSVPEGYTFTVLSALAAIERLLAEPVQAGSFTPARRFGADFVKTIDGVDL